MNTANIEMDLKRCDGSPCTGATSEKRRKTEDPVDFSIFKRPASISQSETLSFHKTFPQTSTSTNPLSKIPPAMNTLSGTKNPTLLDEEKAYKQEIETLKLHLTESAEVKMSQLIIEKGKKIAELMFQNSEFRRLRIDQATRDTELLNAAANRIIELQRRIKSDSLFQERLKLKEIELRKANMMILELQSERRSLSEKVQDLLPKAARVDELEEELRVLKGIVTTNCHVSEDQVLPDETFNAQMSNYAEWVKSQLNDLEQDGPQEFLQQQWEEREDVVMGRNVESGLELPRNYLSVPVNNESYPEEIPKICEFSQLGSSTEDVKPNRRLLVGTMDVIPSDMKFFDINWQQYYHHQGPSHYGCAICGELKKSKIKIVDHLWLEHFGGEYKCPFCSHHSASSSGRYGISRHMLRIHFPKKLRRPVDYILIE